MLPAEWLLRDMNPDYGLDKELTIVEGEDVTNRVVWLQLKATEKLKPNQKSISYHFETKHLRYWERCRLPVIVLYWVKSSNEFYYLFAQRYINEMLSPSKPEWRNQKTVSVGFPLESKLVDTESLTAIATEGHLYVMQQQLEREAGSGPHYWLDGIPKSDDTKLKKYTLKALECASVENHPGAIEQLEKALKECTVGPTEKMSLLLNLGNEYYGLSQNKEASKNYQAMLELADRVTEKEALEGKANALGNIGLIYSDRGNLDQALKYHKGALKIHREIGYKQGEASDLGNIGLIYSAKGDLNQALKYHNDALKVDQKIGYKRGEASDFGNIGLIYSAKGDLNQALKYHKDALKIDREIGYKQGEAGQLGNIGLIYRAKGDLNQALKYLKDALKIHREIGYKQGEANQLGNIGLIYSDKGDLDQALRQFEKVLVMERELGRRWGEATALGNIGLIYENRGDLDQALNYMKQALKIFEEIGMPEQVGIAKRNIERVSKQIKQMKQK